uniref:ComEA family DNA-binding protein n=1 Tax=Thermocrispum agreste TaxID=37925 RepID=A0A2W4JRF3_9PSEU|nr:MAG: ComEA family DNA-binding protein [Thermocrispum agreste]
MFERGTAGRTAHRLATVAVPDGATPRRDQGRCEAEPSAVSARSSVRRSSEPRKAGGSGTGVSSAEPSPDARVRRTGIPAEAQEELAGCGSRSSTEKSYDDGELAEYDEPIAEDEHSPPGRGSRITWWRPGSGKHRLGAARDVVRSAASVPLRVLVAAAVVVAVVGVAVVTAFASPAPAPAEAPPLPAAQRSEPRPPAGGDADVLVVSVVGAVRKPGLVRLQPGARVDDALRAAGGAKPKADLRSVNLARKVADGEQVFVPEQGGGGATADAGTVGTDGADGVKVNINTATAAELETLPGIGEVTAGNIIAWREQHGPFTSVEQLLEVDGIGDRRLSQLRDRVTV